MKKIVVFLMVLGLFIGSSSLASAGFYAATDQLGYQGTVWNITDNTAPVQTSTPRDAALYVVVDAPQYWANYNQLLSSWWEHSPSNQNDSFFQLDDTYYSSVTSANGWWDSSLKKFNVSVTGQNAPYPWSRFWQPDNGVAWGVTITDYSYAFAATFSTEATLDINGFYVNSIAPDTIVGSFTGEFVVTAAVDKSLIENGDKYGFNINLSKAMFTSDGGTYGSITPYNEFGSTTVPEPATMLLFGLGLLGLAGLRRKFKK